MSARLRADLHVHTCLSPCGALAMSPAAVAAAARERGLAIIAICDHNTAENAAAVVELAAGRGPTVLPGIELTTREEVHLLGLFGRLEGALAVQELAYRHLPGENDPEVFGLQPVVDAEGFVTGFNPRLLAGAIDLSIEELVAAIHEAGGLAVAAHVDRQAFGLVGQLGFVPPGLALDALEISRHATEAEARVLPGAAGLPFVRGSDAHDPGEIGSAWTDLEVSAATFAELKLALAGRDGRGVVGTGVA